MWIVLITLYILMELKIIDFESGFQAFLIILLLLFIFLC